jgi:prepilin-type N-terminal cleavage/methylation domain-containing protein
MNSLKNKQGFTLIEIIVVLVILGIASIVLGNAIVYGIQGYVFARNADPLSQKAQLALARLNKELIASTSISSASADQVDFTSPRNAPSCTIDTGCQYSIKRTGNQITLSRITAPAIGAQVLIDGLTNNNGGIIFLSYFRADGSAWATEDGFDTLATIQIRISLDVAGGMNPLKYDGTINRREHNIPNAPQLN